MAEDREKDEIHVTESMVLEGKRVLSDLYADSPPFLVVRAVYQAMAVPYFRLSDPRAKQPAAE